MGLHKSKRQNDEKKEVVLPPVEVAEEAVEDNVADPSPFGSISDDQHP
jgi:hypothetical protein